MFNMENGLKVEDSIEKYDILKEDILPNSQ